MLFGNVAHKQLFLDAVHAKGLAGHNNLRALCLQLLDGSLHRLLVHVFQLDKGMTGADKTACAQVNIRDIGLLLRQPALNAAVCHTDDANFRHVAFQQGVGGLRGAVRNEHNIVGVDVVLGQAVFKTFYHARGNAHLVVVRGHDNRFPDNLVSVIVQRNGFCVRAAHVNAYADLSGSHVAMLSFPGPGRAFPQPQLGPPAGQMPGGRAAYPINLFQFHSKPFLFRHSGVAAGFRQLRPHRIHTNIK